MAQDRNQRPPKINLIHSSASRLRSATSQNKGAPSYNLRVERLKWVMPLKGKLEGLQPRSMMSIRLALSPLDESMNHLALTLYSVDESHTVRRKCIGWMERRRNTKAVICKQLDRYLEQLVMRSCLIPPHPLTLMPRSE